MFLFLDHLLFVLLLIICEKMNLDVDGKLDKEGS